MLKINLLFIGYRRPRKTVTTVSPRYAPRKGHRRPLRKPEYQAWCDMRNRCMNPNNINYADYGGRGIKVSPAWDRFEAFLADVGKRTTKNHSIDRIDNDGDYAPGNVRWSTRKRQQRNRRQPRCAGYGPRRCRTT